MTTLRLADPSADHVRQTTVAGRTAMTRSALSRPVAMCLRDELLPAGATFFDYGCGRGGDVRRLRALGHAAHGWDPVHADKRDRHVADVVNLGYVVNVIRDVDERARALTSAWALARKVLIVAARLDWEARGLRGASCGDGWVTGTGTFQKFFTHEELRIWIQGLIGVAPLATAPGVFYAFRRPIDAERYRAGRVLGRQRRVVLDPSLEYDRFAPDLERLVSFVELHGRLPAPDEDEAKALAELRCYFGSLRQALACVERVRQLPVLENAGRRARERMTVYLALAGFVGRPKFTDLPEGVQRDTRQLFGSYKTALRLADNLLFSVGRQEVLDKALGTSSVGKRLPDALYVHKSALERLDPVLQVYAGCGQVVAGEVPEATIIKMQRVNRRITYLAYPSFDRDPHPRLELSVRADLRTLDLRFTDFSSSENPPILHRKETLVADNYPTRRLFEKLTAQEERAGLLSSSSIGTQDGWQAALAANGYRLRGHRLVRDAARDQGSSAFVEHQLRLET